MKGINDVKSSDGKAIISSHDSTNFLKRYKIHLERWDNFRYISEIYHSKEDGIHVYPTIQPILNVLTQVLVSDMFDIGKKYKKKEDRKFKIEIYGLRILANNIIKKAKDLEPTDLESLTTIIEDMFDNHFAIFGYETDAKKRLPMVVTYDIKRNSDPESRPKKVEISKKSDTPNTVKEEPTPPLPKEIKLDSNIEAVIDAIKTQRSILQMFKPNVGKNWGNSTYYFDIAESTFESNLTSLEKQMKEIAQDVCKFVSEWDPTDQDSMTRMITKVEVYHDIVAQSTVQPMDTALNSILKKRVYAVTEDLFDTYIKAIIYKLKHL